MGLGLPLSLIFSLEGSTGEIVAAAAIVDGGAKIVSCVLRHSWEPANRFPRFLAVFSFRFGAVPA